MTGIGYLARKRGAEILCGKAGDKASQGKGQYLADKRYSHEIPSDCRTHFSGLTKKYISGERRGTYIFNLPQVKPGRLFQSNKLIAFVFTTDPNRARPCERDILSLDLSEEHPFALVSDTNGIWLREFRFRAIDTCRSIAAGVQELQAKGVEFFRYEGVNQDADSMCSA
jgi:hypothetical protein